MSIMAIRNMVIEKERGGYRIGGPLTNPPTPCDRSRTLSFDELAVEISKGINSPVDYRYFAPKHILKELKRAGIGCVSDTAEIYA